MATDNELISIADLIVGLRDSATHACNIAAERKATIEQRDAEIASFNKKLAEEKKDLVAEADALRRGIIVYRGAYVNSPGVDPRYVEEWEASVGSIIWPRKLAVTVLHLQQPWHAGEVPPALTSVPGVEWEVEKKNDTTTTYWPLIRHRPTNLSWNAVLGQLGKAHCLSGVKRWENPEINAVMKINPGGYESNETTNSYHKEYSAVVEFFPLENVTEEAICRARKADIGGRREYLETISMTAMPFRFVDSLGRPVSWTFLDPKMSASGAEPKAAAAEPPPQDSTVHPGAEFRQGLRPKIFEKLTDVVWVFFYNPDFASRPVNSTWAEVQRRAAEILGREDCLAGRERLTTAKGGIYDAVGMTHEDRTKTDAAAVAYQKAYSDAVVKLRDDDISCSAKIAAQQRGAVKWVDSSDPMSSFCFVEKNDGLPISWRALDPDMETKHTATAVLRDREPGSAGTISIEAKRDSLEALIDGSEFRTKRAWSCLPPIPGVVWENAKNSYEVRPVNMTWGEVHRRAADILGEDDAKAGKERMSKEMIYDALNLTEEDRTKTDVAEFAYNKAYSGAVPYLRSGRVSDKAAGAAKKRGAWLCRERRSDDPLAPFMYIDGQGQPIAWRLLDPEMESEKVDTKLAASVAKKVIRIRGGAYALAVLMLIFTDGPSFTPSNSDAGYVEMLIDDGLVYKSPTGLNISDGGKSVLDNDLKNLRATIFLHLH